MFDKSDQLQHVIRCKLLDQLVYKVKSATNFKVRGDCPSNIVWNQVKNKVEVKLYTQLYTQLYDQLGGTPPYVQ